MASYNRVIMMGNLTRDPEFKQLSSGQILCRLGLASNRQFKNRQTGDVVQEVCFVDIDVWGTQAESCKQYLEKGRAVLIEGRLKFDTWEDNEGQRRSKHSIVADRVTFLPMGAQLDNAEDTKTSESGKRDSFTKMKSESDGAKSFASSNDSKVVTNETDKKNFSENNKSSKTTTSGEVNFSADKPFEDELPF